MSEELRILKPYTYKLLALQFSFSRSVVSYYLQPRGLQYVRPPWPLTTPRVYPNSCPLSRWCYPTISYSVVTFSSSLQSSISISIRVFSNESVLCIRWPKYWSFRFNISPSSEHPGQISFRMDWLDLLTVLLLLILMVNITKFNAMGVIQFLKLCWNMTTANNYCFFNAYYMPGDLHTLLFI